MIIEKKKKNFTLQLSVIISVVLLLIGTGYKRLSAGSEETYKEFKLFTEVIKMIEENYVEPVNTKDLVEKSIHGMLISLDPHSMLLTPDKNKQTQMAIKGKFVGIGIVISIKEGLLTVVSPIEDTPAYKARIKANDVITKVDGEPTEGMTISEAVSKIRGKKDTPVVITISRVNTPEPIEFELIRDIIPINSVKYAILKPGYGYIRITNFQENTTKQLISSLEKLESDKKIGGLKGLILDLRNNPGGLLTQAVSVSDVFLEQGQILSVVGRDDNQKEVFEARPDTVKRNYPIVVLVNGGSASASEIVAGALKDNKRALILGTSTFGKGSIQTIKVLRNGYGLKFTVARYYTPSGRSIQAKGIEPDIEVGYKIIDDFQEQKEHTRKEKDLLNHIKSEKQMKQNNKKSDYLKDSQIRRALDILISYDIFGRNQ